MTVVGHPPDGSAAPASQVGIARALDPPDAGRQDAAPGEVVALATSSRTPGQAGDGNVSLVVGAGTPLDHRRRLLAAVGSDLADGVAMEQVHGSQVTVVGRSDAGRGIADHAAAVPGSDALVTFEPDVALLVMTADCVPVLLYERGHGVAAVHAGRRGVGAGVVGAGVEALTDHPDRVTAVIGPAIGGCCYEVPAALAEDFAGSHPEAVATTTWGAASLDLPAAVAADLTRAGVKRIGQVAECTRCGSERWFSHRANPGLGRQGAVIVRRRDSRTLPQHVADLDVRRLERDASAGAVPLAAVSGAPFLDWPS